jgi:hypothetical protein
MTGAINFQFWRLPAFFYRHAISRFFLFEISKSQKLSLMKRALKNKHGAYQPAYPSKRLKSCGVFGGANGKDRYKDKRPRGDLLEKLFGLCSISLISMLNPL